MINRSGREPGVTLKMELLEINAGAYQWLGLLPWLAEEAYNTSLAAMNELYWALVDRQDPYTTRLADITQEEGYDEHFDLWEPINTRWGEFGDALEKFQMEIARRWLIEGGPRPSSLNWIKEDIAAWFP